MPGDEGCESVAKSPPAFQRLAALHRFKIVTLNSNPGWNPEPSQVFLRWSFLYKKKKKDLSINWINNNNLV